MLVCVLLAFVLASAVNLPLSVSGRYIIDSKGARFKLSCVNWYGLDQQDYVVGGLQKQSVDFISNLIAQYGFTCVRLPFSLEMWEKNPAIPAYAVTQEPLLQGKRALDAMDLVITTLAKHNVTIILDNHISDANWCCSDTDGNGLWYTDNYPESNWLNDWKNIVARYASQPYVIGVDLRNELRTATVGGVTHTPTWGTGVAATDWAAAATKAAEGVLSVNSKLLIFVEGINYALDLTGVANNPIKLSIPNRLVYSSHNYEWDYPVTTYTALSSSLDKTWGYIVTTLNTPVWLGEFGTCHTSNSCVNDASGQGLWYNYLHRYLNERDIEWSYWAIDGTQSTGDGRTFGAEEVYGVVNMNWNGPANSLLLSYLQQNQIMTNNSNTCETVYENYPTESSYVEIMCPSGQTINAITFASFGTPTGTCNSFSIGSCHASTSVSVVSNACLNKNMCDVSASTSVFGDPCSGVTKYLSVQVKCG